MGGRLRRLSGDDGLKGKSPEGQAQAAEAPGAVGVHWPAKSLKAFGFKTDLWTTRRLDDAIAEQHGLIRSLWAGLKLPFFEKRGSPAESVGV
jgi:hypothetical protein